MTRPEDQVERVDLKPCPNPECSQDGRLVGYVFGARGDQAHVICGECEMAGPKSAFYPHKDRCVSNQAAARSARELWNGLPRIAAMQNEGMVQRDIALDQYELCRAIWNDTYLHDALLTWHEIKPGTLHHRRVMQATANVSAMIAAAEGRG